MQVTETLNQSLSRSYDVRVPAAELGAALAAEPAASRRPAAASSPERV